MSCTSIESASAAESKTIKLLSNKKLGPEYTVHDIFDLCQLQPYDLSYMVKSFSTISKDIVFYLPRTSNLDQLVPYAPSDRKMEVRHYCMRGRSKESQSFVCFRALPDMGHLGSLCIYRRF